MDEVKKVAEYHLENMIRSSRNHADEKTLQVTSRLPAKLKIRLDMCAEYLDLTRNGLLIDILQAALPSVEAVIREANMIHEQASSAGVFGPFTYDQAVETFTREYERTGKAPASLVTINDLLLQANAEIEANDAVSDETRDALREVGVDLEALDAAMKGGEQ